METSLSFDVKPSPTDHLDGGLRIHPENHEVSQQKSIDKMTLELLVNKRQYQKYLEKCDPSSYDNKREEYELVNKYKYNIGVLFRELLNDYSISGNSVHLGNSEIHHIFEAFVKKSAYYFEETRNSGPFIDEYAEENTLFAHIDEPNTSSEIFNELSSASSSYDSKPSSTALLMATLNNPQNQFREGNSFWGKNIMKRK